jgi:ribulose-5-phosphate 4-epimerase/fuculose-1-phosphate aldolase
LIGLAPAIGYATDFQSLKGRVSAQEWERRVDLAACYRLVDKYEMVDLIYNHISARVDDTHDHILLNLYGMIYKEITASSLAKVDLDGNILWKPETDYGISQAGFVIHSAIHRARPDVGCVLHTHTRAGQAVSAMSCGLLPITQTAMRFYDRIAYHDYRGPVIDKAEQKEIIASLGNKNAMILRNHGLLTCAPTIQQAFNLMYHLERACRAQVDALSGGGDIIVPPHDVLEKTAHLYDPGTRRVYGLLEWHAMLRLLEHDTSNGYPRYDS